MTFDKEKGGGRYENGWVWGPEILRILAETQHTRWCSTLWIGGVLRFRNPRRRCFDDAFDLDSHCSSILARDKTGQGRNVPNGLRGSAATVMDMIGHLKNKFPYH